MRLDTLQQLKLEQKLRLAPRMIQSMEILQLPIMALEERVEQELEKNPVLEIRETDQESAESSSPAQEDTAPDSERELVVQDDTSNQEDFERLENIEGEIDPFEYADHPSRRTAFSDDEDPKHQALANTAAREISLHEYLTLQWDLVEADPEVKHCGELIINHIDLDGYFRTSFEELAADNDVTASAELWEQALRLVHQLDPPGVGARSIQESLLLQLDALSEERSLERLIISDYFDELQNQQFTKIAERTNKPLAKVKEAVEFIRSRLILHPGLTIGAPEIPYITPDVIVDYDETTGGYKVIVPRDSMPRLHISRYYRRMLQDPKVDKTTKQFIKHNIQTGRWLIDAIDQRRQTLERVTEAIVEAQTPFLENGPKFLKPLPMAKIGEQIGVHVATISRAVAGKYVETPRGTYPLRMFFSGGTETADGESISWDAVRAKIQEIIAAEDKSKPLSDDQIVAILKDQGIELARRTVAKYRKLMGIPSSHRRKES